jgi:hypothetical protein
MADWILDDWEDNLTLSSSLNINPHGWVDDEYWFSRGGMVFQANLQNPIETYLTRHEIPAAIRNLYNDLVSCLFPDVNMLVEEYRCWQHGSGHFYKVPDEARFVNRVCDLLVLEVDDELWLAPGTPRRWLEAGQRIELKHAHTIFGEVSYTLTPGELQQSIAAHVDLPNRRCKNVWLFVRSPFDRPMQAVQIDGKPWRDWNAEREAILLPQGDDQIDVTIFY